jgi:hypothetical protein
MIWKGSFIAGFLIAMSILCLIQDSMGKERYIQHVMDNWVTGWFGVPMSILGLLVAIYLVWRSRLLENLLTNNIEKFIKLQKPIIIAGRTEERN